MGNAYLHRQVLIAKRETSPILPDIITIYENIVQIIAPFNQMQSIAACTLYLIPKKWRGVIV